ncbi:MAG: hypothetical protein Tsb0027_08770 [Wenzhouxiangellaceae bacterium]
MNIITMISRVLIAVAALLWCLPTAAADNSALSVEEIVHRANLIAYYQGKDGRAEVQMTITDQQGRERERRMIILRRDDADSDALAAHAYLSAQQYYVYFQRPADLNRTVFMVWKQLDSEDDRWLYLPSLDLVRRIAATDKRNSFVGSDFYYEDVSGRQLDLDEHALIAETEQYYVLRSTPKQADQVEFDWYVSHVHKSTFIPVQISYYRNDPNKPEGHKYREATVLQVETIQGRPTVTRARMQSLDAGTETVMSYRRVEYDVGLPADIFSERHLRSAPRQYMR